MRTLLVITLCSCLVSSALAAEGVFHYRPDAEWTGACLDGESQSPINIERSTTEEGSEDARISITTMGVADRAKILFTGTALQVNLENLSESADVLIPANQMTVGNCTSISIGDPLAVDPLQFHLHTFSEHTIDGFYAPAELHIVTKVRDGESECCDETESGCLAVFGVMLTFDGDGTSSNEVLRTIFESLPAEAGDDKGTYLDNDLSLDDLLPESREYFTYMGSLTTPTCSEIVTWHVFENSIAISTQQFNEHQKLVAFGGGEDCPQVFNKVCSSPREKTNHRDIQPLHGRTVFYHA
eukprot:g8946.t1